MKKIYSLTIASLLGLALVGCTSQPSGPTNVSKLDVANVCNVGKNGVASVLAQAKIYNAIAVKHQVEFKRLGVTTSKAIKGVEAAIKKGSKTVHVVGKKKKVQKFDLNYATERACKFAIRALQQEQEASKNWRKAVPGDGYKY